MGEDTAWLCLVSIERLMILLTIFLIGGKRRVMRVRFVVRTRRRKDLNLRRRYAIALMKLPLAVKGGSKVV